MKAEPEGSVEEPGKEPGSVQQEARTCPVCGTKFFAAADREFCRRFEHYEVMSDEDSKPVELGRGAMSLSPAFNDAYSTGPLVP